MAYVETSLGRLFYEEHGERASSRAAIVLMHGLLFDGGMWRAYVPALSKLGRVLVFDGPGHGRSTRPPDFTLEDHADAMVEAFAALDVERAVIAGVSWGGMVGMRCAYRHPSAIAGLVLIDTSAEVDGPIARARYRAFVAIHRTVGLPRGLYMNQVAPLSFTQRTLRERPDLVDGAYSRGTGFDREGVARASLAVVVRRTNILRELGRIHTPTLVLCGAEDRSTTPANAKAMADGISGARLVLLDGLGHMAALEDPAAVSAHLLPFVRSILGS